LDRIPDGLPAVLDYRTYVAHRSMYNTPPVFAIYVLMLVTRWLRDDVRGLDEQLGRSLAAQIASVGTALVAGTLAYGFSCRLLGVRELRALLWLRSSRRPG